MTEESKSTIVTQLPREFSIYIQRRCQEVAKGCDEVCENWVDWNLYEKMTSEQQVEYWKKCHDLMISVSSKFSSNLDSCTINCVPNDYRGPSSCNCEFPKTQKHFLNEFLKSTSIEFDPILSPEWQINLLPTKKYEEK